jgi:hypothetical protein
MDESYCCRIFPRGFTNITNITNSSIDPCNCSSTPEHDIPPPTTKAKYALRESSDEAIEEHKIGKFTILF